MRRQAGTMKPIFLTSLGMQLSFQTETTLSLVGTRFSRKLDITNLDVPELRQFNV
jgi:hypothetical protein